MDEDLQNQEEPEELEDASLGFDPASGNEYNKYDKGMTKYDPIQTGARLASPRGLQDLDPQKPR